MRNTYKFYNRLLGLLVGLGFSLLLFSTLFMSLVSAADSCPNKDGIIDKDTTWNSSQMVSGKFDCNETEVVVDGATLTLSVPEGSDFSVPFMQTKDLKYKNGGKVLVTIEKPDDTLAKILAFITDPYNVGQIAVSVGAGVQLLSLSSLLSLKDIGLANLIGILGNVFLGTKPKHRPWGMVYNSKTRKPVSFAVISLHDAKTGQLMSTTVSDLEGRYSFSVGHGEYYMVAGHDEFRFPSVTEASKALRDQGLAYTGENIVIDAEKILDVAIPLDPKFDKSGFDLSFIIAFLTRLKNLGREGNFYYTLTLVLINILLIIGKFNVINLAMIIIYSPILISKVLSKTKSPQAWGKVFNSKTNEPVNFAFVRLYDAKSLELINTKVTDKNGKFQFFVEKGEYALLVSATGYKFPSTTTSGETLTFYNGLLKVQAKEHAINVNIPVDPSSIKVSQAFGQLSAKTKK